MRNNSNYIQEEETNSIKDYINLIRLNLIPILLISLTGLIVSAIYAYNAQDIYTSSTAIKIQKPQGGSLLSSPLIPTFSDFGNDRFIANEIEILESYRMKEIVATTLIDSFNSVGEKDSFYLLLNRESEFLEDNTTQLKSVVDLVEMLVNVKIEQKRGLDIVDISIESPSPFEAALIANCYADSYEKLNLKYTRQQLITVKDFLGDQRKEKLSNLLTAEENLTRFQEEGGIIAIDQQASALIDLLTNFESERDATIIEMTIAKQSLVEYKLEIDKKNPSITEYIENYATEPRLKHLQEEIARLEIQRDLALTDRSKSSFSSADIVAKHDNRIDDLKTQLDRQLNIFKASIFASSPEELKELSLKALEAEVRFKALEASYENLNQIVRRYERRFDELPKQTIDFARYQRELTANEKLYLLIEEKYQESLINEQSTPGNVLIIDEARRPIFPSKPNRKLIVIVGLILGIGLGLGFAFIRNYFDNTVKTPEDIQKQNINVLGWIPSFETTSNSNEFEFIVARKSDSIHSEAYRSLRTRIQFSKIERDALKSILITSSAPREGKTTVALNIAGSFAQANRKTVLLDCDLRKPRMHTVFKTERFPGFTDYFFGQAKFEDIIHHSEVGNLDFITAGTIPPNPSEILGSPQMEAFINKLKTIYDLVIVDSPPIIAVTDSDILSRILDATILVVSANETEIELMTKSVELLQHERDTFIGVLLNNFSYRSGYGAYYKHYYYYTHHKDDGEAKKKSVS